MPASASDELDLIVCATTTPDETFPATATRVQARLGMTRGSAFDVQAVCSGFVYALAVADNFIKAGQARTVLVIGAETMSRLMDWTDRTTCVLFGDGAGAVVLRAGKGEGTMADTGVLNTKLFSDGRLHDLLYVDGGPSSTQTTGFLRMQGKEVFRHAVTNISAAIQASADAAGVDHRRDRLVRAPSGQSAHPRRHGPEAGHRAREGGLHRGRARQHLGRLGAAGAGRGGGGRPHQEGRSGAAGGHGRRLHLGRGSAALVKSHQDHHKITAYPFELT